MDTVFGDETWKSHLMTHDKGAMSPALDICYVANLPVICDGAATTAIVGRIGGDAEALAPASGVDDGAYLSARGAAEPELAAAPTSAGLSRREMMHMMRACA